MAKKYVTGQHPIFDAAYIKFHNKSDILNQANRGVFAPVLDLQNCKNIKAELSKIITEMESNLAGVKSQFKDYQQQMINEGWDKPTEMPSWLTEEFFQLEAQINIRQNEIEKLDKIINDYKKTADEAHRKEVLRNGVQGSGSLRDGVVVEIDDQKVSVIDGWPVIDDEFSPFDGMRVADYRRVVNSHLEKKSMKRQEAEQYKKECLENNKPFDEGKYLRLFRYREVDPSWPKGVKNWKK
ncbi:MAG: hypothetical protein RBT65_17535 [Methanolobus sp.]|nr:hypothetical protein [Methanolobus sp.]